MAKLWEKDVMAADVMERRGHSIRALACAPVAEVVLAWMKEQEERVRASRRPAPVRALYDQLVVEHGFTGSYKSVWRFVRRRQARPRIRPSRRVEVRPGTQAQVDWVQTRVWVEDLGGLVKLWAFVMVLSASRMWAVVWSRRKNMASWIRCHNEAFARLGGVPLSLRPDNEKTAAGFGTGPWAEVNEGYETYAGQMGFLVNLAPPPTPTDKGKVERRGRDVKWHQIRAEDCFADLGALQRTTDLRITARSKRLICPPSGLSVHESWLQEKLALAPLPATLPEPFDTQVCRSVGRDCLVSFEGRRYLVPFGYAGRQVQVRGAGDRVEILADHRVVKSYPRGTQARLLIDQADYEGHSTDRVAQPTPLGELGEQIVLQRSWEAPKRPIERYAAVLGRLA